MYYVEMKQNLTECERKKNQKSKSRRASHRVSHRAQLLKRDLTLVSLGHNDKVVFKIHAICRHVGSDTHTSAFTEEEGGGISQFHPSEIDAETAIGASTKGTESAFGCCALFFAVEPA